VDFWNKVKELLKKVGGILPTCQIWADTPTIEFDQNNIGTISGQGHRECMGALPNDARVEIRLRQDRSGWFDKTLASIQVTGTDIHKTVSYKCKGKGSQVVFTEILAKSGKKKKAQSGRRGFNLCS
jgi:hypothetical protein